MSKLAPSNITITCWPPYKLVSTPANIPLVHNVTSNSKSEIGHLQPWTKRNPDQWHISGAEHEWHGEGGGSEEASNDSHLPLLSLWGDSRGEGKGAPICLSEKHFAQGGIHFCEEQTLLYPAGCGVARVKVDNSGNGGQQDLVWNRAFQIFSKLRNISHYTRSGANGEQGSEDHRDRTQPDSAASRLHRERGEASSGTNPPPRSKSKICDTQVVYDLEKRKRVKLLRCAEFRTLEVVSPRFQFLHLATFLKYCRWSPSPSPTIQSTCWHRGALRTTSLSTSFGRKERWVDYETILNVKRAD